MHRFLTQVQASVAHFAWADKVGRTIQGGVNRVFHGSRAGRRTKDFLNGVWLAHPLHPVMTYVPIGAWTTAFALDRLGGGRGGMARASSAAIGIGIGGAVLAALTGLADWSDTIGEVRRVGFVHGATNSLALVLHSGSLRMRLRGDHSRGRALSAVGFATLLVGGYLGGELVFRLGAQVDRNANARAIRDFTPVMAVRDLMEDQPVRVEADGTPILLVRRGERIFALSDICSHAGCRLSQGRLAADCIVCACHGSTYRLEDGGVVHGPSTYDQPHYLVRIEDGQIEVCTPVDHAAPRVYRKWAERRTHAA